MGIYGSLLEEGSEAEQAWDSSFGWRVRRVGVEDKITFRRCVAHPCH